MSMDMEYMVSNEDFAVCVSSNDTLLEIEFGDGYQQDLMELYGWSNEQATSVDEVLEKELDKKGFECQVCWEDQEFFVIELTECLAGLHAKTMAEVLQTLIPGSTIQLVKEESEEE